MTIAEKLRFLADRIEDEKEFYMGRHLYKYQNGELIGFALSLKTLPLLDLKLKPNWKFTEDEKVILRNLPDDFQWIARDKSDWLYVHTKDSNDWGNIIGYTASLMLFNHLFQCIQWSDDEPCEFRKYL